VKCGFCGRPFHLGDSSFAPNRDAVLVTDRLWRDAVDGSKLFERYLLGLPCGWLPPRFIWSLASIPVRRQRGLQIAFGLIVPEASAPPFGMLETVRATTCRTANPFRRLVLIAAVHRFNQDPIGCLQELSGAATAAGRAGIASLLSTLPNAVAGLMHGNVSPPAAGSGYLCQAVEMHQVRLRLTVNLRQIRELLSRI
jgi:hypothetical protein